MYYNLTIESCLLSSEQIPLRCAGCKINWLRFKYIHKNAIDIVIMIKVFLNKVLKKDASSIKC